MSADNSTPTPDSGEDDLAELMYIKCADCGRWVDVKPGKMNLITHTLCKECLDKQLRELEQMDGEKPPE